ncbi:ATP-binding protein [Erysipelothrix rhusiopathiae]|nr:ATP-binding protein [Erysipelothrix rhusiopathiae]
MSGIPSDIVPVILGVTTRLLNNVQFWMNPKEGQIRNPISLFCDEAHIYMAKDMSRLGASEKKSLAIFENIAKEGRKYGLGLVIISQRPSELNSTIISQFNNIMSLKVTNERDKNAIASMLTDSLVGLVDLLPNLDVGECIVAGDAIVLPTRIKLNEPSEKPNSTTIDFWSKWIDGTNVYKDIEQSVHNMIKQSR